MTLADLQTQWRDCAPDEVLAASPAWLDRALRCLVTGNLIGTDTWPVDSYCPCPSCKTLVSDDPVCLSTDSASDRF